MEVPGLKTVLDLYVLNGCLMQSVPRTKVVVTDTTVEVVVSRRNSVVCK